MKPTSILVGALAAVATAAPTEKVEARGSFDASVLNGLNFANQNLAYFNSINSLDLALLQQLATVNNFNVGQFGGLFSNNIFDVNALLQFQQLQQVLQLGQLGLFNGFDLSSLAFGGLDFGLVNSLSGFDLASLIDASLQPQIAQVIQQTAVIIKE